MLSMQAVTRRDFVKLSLLSGAALAIGCVPSSRGESRVVNLGLEPMGPELNPFIFIADDGTVTIYNHRPEMGQGTFQAIPMIVAEELGVTLENVRIKPSPANRGLYGDQMVVGSRSINSNYDWMRKVGAAARQMLTQAAAKRWNVRASECYAEAGNIVERSSGRELPYAELVAEAALMEAPQHPTLKDPRDFTVIGKSLPRQDVPAKTNGSAQYGLDIHIPGMLYASIERSPVFLGKVVSFDADKAMAVTGVRHVFATQREVWGHVREGVAVLADTYWAAYQGRKALKVVWDNGDLEKYSTEYLWKDYAEAAKAPGDTFQDTGNFSRTYGEQSRTIEATYKTPYQSHATMEPMNATVSVEGNRCRYWGSTQNPNGYRSFLAGMLNIPEGNVEINYTFMGGGLGRRSQTDVVEEAADLSRKASAPVKVVWTREDDLTQGPFRACSLNVCRGAVDDQGNLAALEHKVICQDIRNQTGESTRPSGGITGGINTEYAIPHFRLAGVLRKHYIPITYWRSVYHSTNCFAHESMIDELAALAGRDPLQFRLAMLKNHRRYTKVLNMVAEKSGWSGPQEKDSAKGVAIVERSGAFVAMVAEVKRINQKVKLTRIVATIDCGRPVNPDIIRAQTEGGIVMGITAACKSGLTVNKGRMEQQNFDTYHMAQLADCPEIEVYVIDTDDPPEGAGEAGVPPIAPAMTNAIFALTGKRIRELPFKLEEV